jgi:hypothetical protein
MVAASCREWMSGGGGESCEKDVEKSVPVARGRNVTLAGAHYRIKAPEVRGRGMKREGFGTPSTENVPG